MWSGCPTPCSLVLIVIYQTFISYIILRNRNSVTMFLLQKYSIKPKLTCMPYEDFHRLVFSIQPFSGSCSSSLNPNILLRQCPKVVGSHIYHVLLSYCAFDYFVSLPSLLSHFSLGKYLFSVLNSPSISLLGYLLCNHFVALTFAPVAHCTCRSGAPQIMTVQLMIFDVMMVQIRYISRRSHTLNFDHFLVC